MPLRDVIYYGQTIEKLVDPEAIYRKKQIPLPTPEFYVFYNGDDAFPAEKILKLSDAYLAKTNTPKLELLVKVININLTAGHAILEQCRPLYEYSWFIQKIKDYSQKNLNRDTAIKLAIQDCIQAGIFANFVQEHGLEAVNMLFTQINLEDAKKVWYREAFEDGEESGEARGEMLTLIKLVCRKLQKGKSPEMIAAELEEPLENVRKICTAVDECGTDADCRKVFEYMQD